MAGRTRATAQSGRFLPARRWPRRTAGLAHRRQTSGGVGLRGASISMVKIQLLRSLSVEAKEETKNARNIHGRACSIQQWEAKAELNAGRETPIRFASGFPLGIASGCGRCGELASCGESRSRETLDSCGCGHAFHIIHPLCTGNLRCLWETWETGGVCLKREAGFSKTPDLHNRDLENRAGRSTRISSGSSDGFPLFQRELRVLLSFLLFFLLF